MGKSSEEAKTLSEAIEQLEQTTKAKAHDAIGSLGQDLQQIAKALENLKPYLDDLKQKTQAQAEETKNITENQIKENPWIALGIAGLIGLIVGWILGNSKK